MQLSLVDQLSTRVAKIESDDNMGEDQMNSSIQGANEKFTEIQEKARQKFHETDANPQTIYVEAQAKFTTLDEAVKKHIGGGSNS